MSGAFGWSHLGREAPCHFLEKARNAAKYYMMHETAPQAQNHIVQNVSSAQP